MHWQWFRKRNYLFGNLFYSWRKTTSIRQRPAPAGALSLLPFMQQQTTTTTCKLHSFHCVLFNLVYFYGYKEPDFVHASGLLLCCLCSVWLAGTRPWVRFFSDAVRFTGGWTVIARSPPCSDHTNHPSALFKWKHFHSNPMQQRRHTNQRDVGAVPRKTKT